MGVMDQEVQVLKGWSEAAQKEERKARVGMAFAMMPNTTGSSPTWTTSSTNMYIPATYTTASNVVTTR